MKKLTNKRGISLIVLVITIIVMIILASAIILSLSNSGIIGKANEAKNKTDKANMIEAANLALGEYELEKQLGELSPANQTAEEYVKGKLAGQFTDDMLKSLSVLDDGTIQILPTIPEGFVVSQIDGEKKISEGLVIYELKEGEDEEDINWTETDTTTVEGQTLLKVQTERDQYVWVPVEGAFERIAWNGEDLETYLAEPIRADMMYMDDITKYQGEIEQYYAMKASVEKNGGFYIARYEAGQEGTTAVSKKGTTVFALPWDSTWDEIGYGKDTNDGAAKISKKSYENAERHLIYGVQWDAALKFIEDEEHSVTDSSTWGNYLNYNDSVDESKKVSGVGVDEVTTAGYSEYWKAKNIYDMAGNVYELTYEVSDYDDWGIRVWRGGNCSYDGGSKYISSNSASSRFTPLRPSPYNQSGAFRFVLYIK